ncbi:predicted protein, partial [Nematostella vectensis]
PIFNQTLYSAIIPEDFTVGGTLLTVLARDQDAALNARVTYSIVSFSTESDYFVIDNITGVVRSSKEFDYETQRMYSFSVRAEDRGSPIRSAIATIHVQITDTNDNRPIFQPMEYETRVSENTPLGTIVARVKAVDKDSTSNADLIYSIQNGNNNGSFTIDNSTGEIMTRKEFDFEKTERYNLTISVSDTGVPALSSLNFANVVIIVVDENDNPPEFAQKRYTATVYENFTVGTVVLRVTAHDKDSGPNAMLKYSIHSGNTDDAFVIIADSGDISLDKPLDKETIENYTLVLIVTDMGIPPLESIKRMVVNVIVSGVNEHAPRFLNEFYNASIPENLPLGTSIVRVRAVEDDVSVGARFIYVIKDAASSKVFLVNQTGDITLARELDYETRRRYEFEMYENVTSGTQVLTLFAHDRDEGINGQVFYYIVTSSVKGVFTTNSTTGVVSLTAELDRESVYQYNMLVVAQDGGSPPRTASAHVKVEVLDCNDNPPVFTTLYYTLQLSEATSIGTRILRVSANDRDDKDEGVNAEIRYFLKDAIVSKKFSINDTTGQITIKQAVDYEERSSYSFEVFASDGGEARLTGSSSVRITIIDVNDNRPYFLPTRYYVQLVENVAIGTPVTQVTASDLDSSLNGKVLFSILGGNSDGKFVIDQNTGVVTTNKSLDYEDVTEYTLVIQATDCGDPPLNSSQPGMLHVSVVNINDNSPVFSQKMYSASIDENTTVGHVILRVTASDLDSSLNGKVLFSILEGNSDGKFVVDQNTGVVTTNKSLDYEDVTEYTLVIQATDCGDPPLNSSQPGMLHVSVVNINDNSPV